jgi:ketosteroid isomerase-like protein
MGIFRNEEKKVRETIELYANGFVDKDLDMIMSLVALDEDFLFINQNPYEKIIGAKKFYIRTKEMLKASDDIDIGIEWMFLSVADNTAWVNSEMRFCFKSGNHVTDEYRSVTFVLEKRRGDWYIVHVINSVCEIEEEQAVSEETEIYDFDNHEMDLDAAVPEADMELE